MNDILWTKSNPPVRLAIVLRPQGGKGLRDELLHVKNAGVQNLVSLLEPGEAEFLGLAEESAIAEEICLPFLNYPIPDAKVPHDIAHFRTFVSGLADRLRSGESVGVHCRGCIGRSTITAACMLIHMGMRPMDAVVAVEAARGCRVPDTDEQLNWILHYKAKP
jgi:protein-tyrosine phosphatase